MLKRIDFFQLLAITGLSVVGLCSTPQPTRSQSLVPYVLQLDEQHLEQQGFFLFHSVVESFRRGEYDLEQAAIRIQLASQIAPDNPQILMTLGELHNIRGKYEQAIDVLSQARGLDPENPAVLFALGTAYLRQSQYTQAVTLFEEGLNISPEVSDALFDLGNAYYQLKQYDDAIASYKRAVEIKEDLWFAVNNIGLVLYEQQDTKGAIEYWEQSVEMTNRQEAEPLLALAVAQFHQGDREEALTLGTRALIINSAYGDLEFLEENLWGEMLLADTEEFLRQPQIRSLFNENSRHHEPH
ncbi:MAG: tetratricopeptide repeat protein [Cyanobacteria bacterium P01_F01_bin.150]